MHACAQETYHFPEHPYIIRTINTTISLTAPPNIHSPRILPTSPPINIPNALPIDHTLIFTTLSYPYPHNATYTNPLRRPPFSSVDQTGNKDQARRSNIPGQNNNYSNIIQNHVLKDRRCLVSGTLNHKPITILIDIGSSISFSDEQLYCLLSFVPSLQPIQFSVSGVDDRSLIALGMTSLSIAFDDKTFQVQLVVTRNILFRVVLGINFLQIHGGIISFPTNQLYLTTSSSTPADQPINPNRIYNTYTPPIHAPTSHHPHPRITVPPTIPIMSLILHQSLSQPEKIP